MFHRVKSNYFHSIFISILFVILTVDFVWANTESIPFSKISYNFYDSHFINPKTGWICGKSGYLFKTEDGGTTWKRQITNTVKSLFSVRFIDELNGFIVGQKGLAIMTEDGGQTWREISIPIEQNLMTLDFYDHQHGIAAGDWGKIIVTEDGGKTWREISLEHDIVIYDIEYISLQEIWLSCEMGNLFHTTDGGNTWSQMELSEGTIFGIDFDENGIGVAVGIAGSFLYTIDGGQNWEIRKISQKSLYNIKVNGDKIIAIGDAGTILKQYTGSLENPWQQIEVPNLLKANWLQFIDVIDKNKFIIGGARGSICFIENEKLIH